MGLLVGIDGGGSGCRVAVALPDGTVLAVSEGGPANIATDPQGAVASILATAGAAFRTAVGSRFQAEMQAAHAGLGLAGANVDAAVAEVSQRLPFARAAIETDALVAARGALRDADGLLAAIGTGSVFVVQQAGRRRQVGGWGLVLGDEGSGARLGLAALKRAMAAAEGQAPMTPLLHGLLGRFGGMAGVIGFSLAAAPADFARLAPEVLAAGDAAAAEIWQESVAEVARVLHGLGAGRGLAVTFAGGLGPAYSAALAELPQRPAAGTTLDGALALARIVP